MPSAKCSTPSGIKGTIALLRLAGQSLPKEVLNAFRHQRNNRLIRPYLSFPPGQCSTPSGIKGTIARKRHTVFTSGKRAQRLPASKEQSPLSADNLVTFYECSTPSGIKGTIAHRFEH